MTRLMTIHLAGGSHALLSGTTAVAARKGGAFHARAGAGFVLSMLVIGLSATVLARLQEVPESGQGGLLSC